MLKAKFGKIDSRRMARALRGDAGRDVKNGAANLHERAVWQVHFQPEPVRAQLRKFGNLKKVEGSAVRIHLEIILEEDPSLQRDAQPPRTRKLR